MIQEAIGSDAFPDLVQRRRSHRGGYRKDTEVSHEHIQFILEAARWAPSAGNAQPWEFLVIRDPKTRDAIAELLRRQLGIPDPLQVYHLIPIGYMTRPPHPKPRREVQGFVHYERYDPRKFRADEQIKAFLASMGIRSPNYRW